MTEEPYRAIVESADDPISSAIATGATCMATRSRGQLRPDGGPLRRQDVDELFTPDVAAGFRAGVRRVVDSGETLKTEDRVVIDGVELWSSTVMQPLRDADGRVTAVQGIVRDITSRKQAEMALQASEERLRQVIRASHIGVFDLDFTRRTVYWSPEQRAIWGWGADEPLAWDEHRQYIHRDDAEKVLVASAAAHHRPDGVFELEHRHRVPLRRNAMGHHPGAGRSSRPAIATLSA